jgi:hypothetical protein
MKLTTAIASLLIPVTATALSCGKTITKACLGESDIRYDPKASNALKDQARVYQIRQGYFECTQQYYDAAGLPLLDPSSQSFQQLQQGLFPPGFQQSLFPFYVYINNTYSGSRTYVHRVNIYESFEDGGPGISVPHDGWGTSTYEKDGTLDTIGIQLGYGDVFQPVETSYTYPVNNRTVYISGNVAGALELFVSEVQVCLDDNCIQSSGNQDTFLVLSEDVSIRFSQSVWNCDKMGSAEEWEGAIQDAYLTYNVSEVNQVPIPMQGECITGACPTENDWCKTDPECSESPYKEPDGSVKSGAIAGFTVAGIVLLMVALFVLHAWLAHQQARRYKTKFAKRIADTINVGGSMRQLQPEALASEFKRMDSESKDGSISKEALWNFLSSGKAGELSETDFNALFAAIDLDQNGTVDFMEFCTFMGKCSEEYRAVRPNRGSAADRASRRNMVANASARQLSIVAPGSDDATTTAALAAIEDAEASKDRRAVMSKG